MKEEMGFSILGYSYICKTQHVNSTRTIYVVLRLQVISISILYEKVLIPKKRRKNVE